MKNIGCILYYDMDKYEELAECSYKSFIKWHPEIETHLITPKNINNYREYEWNNKTNQLTQVGNKPFQQLDLSTNILSADEGFACGINKYMTAREIMFKNNYDKIIILGVDTITTYRLDEFLDNDDDDILATLNYDIHESTDYWSTPIVDIKTQEGDTIQEHLNINADVVCFNSLEALESILELSINHRTYFNEQGGLNEMAFANKKYSVNIVDSPYILSNVSYNIRSKGVPRLEMIGFGDEHGGNIVNCWPNNIHGFDYDWLAERNLLDGQPSPIKSWYVEGDKLFTHDNKQIKCFHYAEGLGCQTIERFNEKVNSFKNNWFNEQTIKFFRENCNCTNFFGIGDNIEN